MPITLPTRVRKDPLGALFYNNLLFNHVDLQRLVLRGHNADGTHNELEVPRMVGGVTALGAVAAGSSAGITAAMKISAGVYEITLLDSLIGPHPGAAAVSYPLCVDVMVTDAAGETLPFMTNVEQRDAQTVRVRIDKLAALAGNTWDPTDAAFHVAVYSERYTDPSAQMATIVDARHGHGLRPDRWNQLGANMAKQYTEFLDGHKTTGAHNILEVARGWLKATFAAGVFSIAAGESQNVTSISRPSAGLANVVLPGASYVDPIFVFGRAGAVAANPEQQYLITVPTPSKGALNVRMYRYSETANTWSATDGDFDLFIHSGAI